MYKFDDIYNTYIKGKCINASPEIKMLLKEYYDVCNSTPVNEDKLKTALLGIFEFLVSSNGRTSANCWLTDLFIADDSDIWNPDYSNYPQDVIDIIDEIEFLHGAVEEPEFHSSPEIILEMIKNSMSNH